MKINDLKYAQILSYSNGSDETLNKVEINGKVGAFEYLSGIQLTFFRRTGSST